jgi:hypothetical protein
VSYDFAVIPADLVTSSEDAALLHVAMCTQVRQPAPRDVEQFVAQLHRKYGFDNDEDRCILTAESDPDARATVVTTSWQSVAYNTIELLRMTRDFGFALYDPQKCVYDPRTISTSTSNWATAPRSLTSDRSLAQRVLWNWATQTAGWEVELSWQRVDFGGPR